MLIAVSAQQCSFALLSTAKKAWFEEEQLLLEKICFRTKSQSPRMHGINDHLMRLLGRAPSNTVSKYAVRLLMNFYLLSYLKKSPSINSTVSQFSMKHNNTNKPPLSSWISFYILFLNYEMAISQYWKKSSIKMSTLHHYQPKLIIIPLAISSSTV